MAMTAGMARFMNKRSGKQSKVLEQHAKFGSKQPDTKYYEDFGLITTAEGYESIKNAQSEAGTARAKAYEQLKKSQQGIDSLKETTLEDAWKDTSKDFVEIVGIKNGKEESYMMPKEVIDSMFANGRYGGHYGGEAQHGISRIDPGWEDRSGEDSAKFYVNTQAAGADGGTDLTELLRERLDMTGEALYSEWSKEAAPKINERNAQVISQRASLQDQVDAAYADIRGSEAEDQALIDRYRTQSKEQSETASKNAMRIQRRSKG